MHVKTPVFCDKAYVQAKEQQLKEFIRTGGMCGISRGQAVLLLVRSPDCLAARVLVAMSEELAAAGLSAKIIFATAGTSTDSDAVKLTFDSAFSYEARVLHDHRYLDGHEQLVCGTDYVWFGDSMRREPDKRDAFSSFIPSNEVIASRARVTFARIWDVAHPVPAHDRTAERVSVVPAANAIAANALAGEIAATLTDWTPTDRH